MPYIYVVYSPDPSGRPVFAGAWESHDEARKWVGDRLDILIAQVSVVRVSASNLEQRVADLEAAVNTIDRRSIGSMLVG